MSWLSILRAPIRADTRAHLAAQRARLPEAYRTPTNMLGRGGRGCGATIGVMPRCDFACVGCYLGEEANRIPPLPLPAVLEQLRALRAWLGHDSNVQLTDGEVTLRPVEELITILRTAWEIGLTPMLMTHGDSFRRRPGLLERLMVEGHLREVSIHIDTTQRGRLGASYRAARREEELHPLRDEFAAMVRAARRRTGLPLRVASTMTVTADNLAQVPAVLRWTLANADAVGLLSFQPVAQVGRTVDGLGGAVTVDDLWAVIDAALASPGRAGGPSRGTLSIGHPDCNRYVPGLVLHDGEGAPSFHPLRDPADPVLSGTFDRYLDHFGGASFRRDSRAEASLRALALALRAPWFVASSLVPWIAAWLRRGDPRRPGRFLGRLVRGRATVRGLTLVSHHFMSPEELATPHGQQRSALCVFHVPLNGEMVPMCRVNAGGVREEFYAGLAARRDAAAEQHAGAAG